MVLSVPLRIRISLLDLLNITIITNIIVPAWRKHTERCILDVPDVNMITVHSAYTAQVGQLKTRATGNKANVRLIDGKVRGAGEQFINVTAHFIAHISCPLTLPVMLTLSLDKHMHISLMSYGHFYTTEQRARFN